MPLRADGRTIRKRESGYYRRSLAEAATFRARTISVPSLRARGEAAQQMETLLRLNVLNQMTALGMLNAYSL